MTDLIVTRPVTAEYERGHAATFGVKPERFCDGCGRLKVWCECEYGPPRSALEVCAYGEHPLDRPTP